MSSILNAKKYRWSRRNWVFSELRGRFGDDFRTMTLRPDGAQPHATCETIDSLIIEVDDEKQMRSYRGQGDIEPSLLEWRPKSRDHTALDNWFREVFKSRVGHRSFEQELELKRFLYCSTEGSKITRIVRVPAVGQFHNRFQCSAGQVMPEELVLWISQIPGCREKFR